MPSARTNGETVSALSERAKGPGRSNKRKRDTPEFETPSHKANAPGTDLEEIMRGANADLASIRQELLEGNNNDVNAGVTDTAVTNENVSNMAAPRAPELSFNTAHTAGDEDVPESSFDMTGVDATPNNHAQGGQYPVNPYASNGNVTSAMRMAQAQDAQAQVPGQGRTQVTGKPSPQSAEWHKVRKDNHKEVERRRRETINEGINTLMQIVPNCDKQKGKVLDRTVEFIREMQVELQSLKDKQALAEMVEGSAVDANARMNNEQKAEMEDMRKELAHYKKVCVDAGLVGADDARLAAASKSKE